MTDFGQIAAACGMMSTPTLAVDGKVPDREGAKAVMQRART